MKLGKLLTTAGVALGAAACHQPAPAPVSPAQAPAPQRTMTYTPSHSGGTSSAGISATKPEAAATGASSAVAPALTAWGMSAADSASLAGRLHFAFDSSALTQDDLQQLEAKRHLLAADPTLKVRIAGNCDERGSEEYNLALGERRAAAAKRWLVAYGVAADRITITSYGKERPLEPGHDESAWAANRRDDFLVLTH